MTRPIAISGSADFHVSAQRFCDAILKNTPVIMLSRNDGCAMARSDDGAASAYRHFVRGQPISHIRRWPPKL